MLKGTKRLKVSKFLSENKKVLQDRPHKETKCTTNNCRKYENRNTTERCL